MEPIQPQSTMEKMLLAQASASGTPANGSIELLPLCNMNCDMCFVRLSREQMEQKGRLRTAAEWLEIGSQMKEAGVLFLLLTGGEPLLYPDFKEVYTGLRRMGFIITINTNGTLLDEAWADFFAASKPRRINITLYGKDEEAYTRLCHYPGGYQKTVAAVKLLRARGVDVKLGGSLTRTNEQDWKAIIDHGPMLGVPSRIDTYMQPAERERDLPFAHQVRLAPEDAARYSVEIKRRAMTPQIFALWLQETMNDIEQVPEAPWEPARPHCMAGRCSFSINWQGEMRPCVMSSELSVPVFETGFAEAWDRIRSWVDNVRMSPQCNVCRLRKICRTCMAAALQETGSYDGVPEYHCRYTKTVAELVKAEFLAMKEQQNG